MEELKAFLAAGTEFFKTATVYMNMKAQQDKLIVTPVPAPAPTAATVAPAVKAKTKSAPATKAPKTVEEALGTETPAMSEKESLDAAYKLAGKHLEEGGTKEGKEARKQALIAHLKQTYQKANIQGLTHPERVEFIEYLKSLDVKSPEAVGSEL